MIIHADDLLADVNLSVLYLPDADPSDIFIVIDRGNEDLRPLLGISFRCGNVIDDRLKKRLQIRALFIGIAGTGPLTRGCVEERALQLLVRSIQIHEQLEDLVHDLLGPRLRAVDLVDADDDRQIQRKGFLQDKFRLRHCPFKGIDEKNDAVDHFQDTLYLAAEIRMAGSIYNIDLDSVVFNRSILGENRDPPFALDRPGIHDTFTDLLVIAEHTALTEHTVHERRLPVIYMRYDCYISDIFSLHQTHFFFLIQASGSRSVDLAVQVSGSHFMIWPSGVRIPLY